MVLVAIFERENAHTAVTDVQVTGDCV